MKSIVVYYSRHKILSTAQAATLPDGSTLYLRFEEFPYNMVTALAKAKPLVGEAVLNTIPAFGIPQPV